MTPAGGGREAAPGGGAGPGPVTLRIRDGEGVLAFYRDLLGLEAARDGDGPWRLSAPGSTEALLLLDPAPDAPPRPAGTAGLFHVALRVPGREELAAVFLRLRAAGPTAGGGSLEGASDHGVSRALYLADPEGNGLEIYHDRPRESWPSEGGGVAMWTRPLDVRALLDGVEADATLPPGTVVGHVHLRTADLAAAEEFWVERTGMEVTVRSYPGALFLSHGGYHHHLGLNVWGGPFAPAPEGTAGLVRVEWRTGGDGEGEPRVLRAPDGVKVLLRAR